MIDYTFFKPLLNELFYRGVCDIETFPTQKDPVTRKTKKVAVKVYENLPCLLSHESKNTSDSRELPSAEQTIMLFIDPEIDVPAGSKVTVTQDDRTVEFAHSGRSNRFPGHQEIELEKWETWA